MTEHRILDRATVVFSEGVADVRLARPAAAATASQICDGASGVMVVNERGLKALGVSPPAWLKTTGADPATLNVHGGARNKRLGLQTMCEGGGLANVTIIERL